MRPTTPTRVATLYGTIAGHAARQPGREAVIANGEALTYADLLQRIDRLREAFTQSEPALHGERVYISGVDKLELLTAAVATMASGGIAVLAAGGGPAIVEDCDPALIVTDQLPTDETAGGRRHLAPDPASSPGSAGLPAACAAAEPGDAAMILYTSGTTSGVRRGVVLTHGMLTCTTDYMNERMALDASVREYVASPLDHSFGFARARAVLRAGGTLVFDDGAFNPARVLMGVDEHRCNALTGVSAVFAVLLQRFEKHLAKLGNQLRWAEIGSLPLPVELKQRMLDLMPGARIFMHYGLTEASRTTLLDLRQDTGKLGSVGVAAPGVEVRLAQDGEILVRGPNVTPGYWQRAPEWQQKFRDGWLYTGDLGDMDEDGFLYVRGRKDDVINVGGEKFLPQALEEELTPLLQPQAFCIVGVADPQGMLGEVPVLVVEGGPGHSLSEVRQRLSGRVPDYTMPRALHHVDVLPRTDNGKLQRGLVRGLIDAEQPG